VPVKGDAFLRVQRLDRGVGGCHLDVHTQDVDAVSKLAVSLGGGVSQQWPGVAVLRSPGGLAFCVVEWHGQQFRPPPLTWSPGYRSLVDQLCIDIPPDVFDRECGFWAGLTGWEHRRGARSELHHLARPVGLPLRLLLQRLDDGGADRCRAHLDLACTDVTAERRRHEELGATVTATMANWTTLQDPAGLAYCITRRDPETGIL
jgi:hypothetical protein